MKQNYSPNNLSVVGFHEDGIRQKCKKGLYAFLLQLEIVQPEKLLNFCQ